MADMAATTRFPILFSPAARILFRLLLVPPSSAYVELGPDTIHVRMSWAFSGRIPRRLVSSAGPGKPPMIRFTAGAHGWAGRWLVNGSALGIVTVKLAEPTRAYVTGFPIRLKELSVSLEDPDGFLAALARNS
jgi:hypothetical protein